MMVQRHGGFAQRGGTVNAGVQVPFLLLLLVVAVLYPVNVEGFRARNFVGSGSERTDRADLRIQRTVEGVSTMTAGPSLVFEVGSGEFPRLFPSRGFGILQF